LEGAQPLYAAAWSVIAFEPSPWNFKIFEQNIRINRLNTVIACNAAVSDEIGSTGISEQKQENCD
jgi:FkbM family methyltransferase